MKTFLDRKTVRHFRGHGKGLQELFDQFKMFDSFKKISSPPLAMQRRGSSTASPSIPIALSLIPECSEPPALLRCADEFSMPTKCALLSFPPRWTPTHEMNQKGSCCPREAQCSSNSVFPLADGASLRSHFTQIDQLYSVDQRVFVSEVRHILQLSGGSWTSPGRLEIPSDTEVIDPNDFARGPPVREIVFCSNSHCRIIHGLSGLRSLIRIEIPSSVELISFGAIFVCERLCEVIFEANNRLKTIDGFSGCTSLSRIEIPSSVELISFSAFSRRERLTEVIFETNSRLTRIEGFTKCTSLSRF
jgi:hypothetical protein